MTIARGCYSTNIRVKQQPQQSGVLLQKGGCAVVELAVFHHPTITRDMAGRDSTTFPIFWRLFCPSPRLFLFHVFPTLENLKIPLPPHSTAPQRSLVENLKTFPSFSTPSSSAAAVFTIKLWKKEEMIDSRIQASSTALAPEVEGRNELNWKYFEILHEKKERILSKFSPEAFELIFLIGKLS